MPTISLFKYEKLPGVWEISKLLNGKKINGNWFVARLSKYNRNEVFIQYYYYEDVEDGIKRIFSEEDAHEIVSFLKQNGKAKVLKRTYCFINQMTKTLEIYRGPDSKTEEIVNFLEKLLKIKFVPISLKSEDLQRIYSQHSMELKQAMFKNIHGLIYEILRGKFLENNEKYKNYLKNFPQCLRVISFRPKIKFLNSNNKYQITINGDRGTIKFSSNGVFNWRPRYEIRQIIFIIAATLGLLPS
jgi:hypothetical protein